MTRQSQKPVLAIDFDDVLALNASEITEAYNLEFEAALNTANIYTPGTLGNSNHGWKHDYHGAMVWINNYLRSAESLNRPPIGGSIEALKRLSRKYRLVVITGREPEIEEAVHDWIEWHLPGLVDKIYHTGNTPKSDVCKQIGAKIIIDDSPAYIHDCHSAGIEVIVFGEYPWNQDDRLPEAAPRAKDWAEVEEILL